MMKKRIVCMLALMMVLSLAACGKANAPAGATAAPGETGKEEEVLPGGWQEPESLEVPEEVQALFDKALEEIDGAEYQTIAYLGSQVVAGTNHAILCSITPVTQNPVGTYAIVTLYQDPEGGATITEIRNSDAEVKALPDGTSLLGGWEAPESLTVDEKAAAALEKSQETIEGETYAPVAYLAREVVSGTNYELLCKVTGFTEDGEEDYIIVLVYETLEGEANMTHVYAFSDPE